MVLHREDSEIVWLLFSFCDKTLGPRQLPDLGETTFLEDLADKLSKDLIILEFDTKFGFADLAVLVQFYKFNIL